MCDCLPGYTCKTHRTPEEDARMDRVVSTYARARNYLDAAARVIATPLPHNAGSVKVLKKAAESLNAYLAELER